MAGEREEGRLMRSNLHIHSTVSDGHLSPEKIARAASDAGLSAIGFAEHYASSKLPRNMSVTAADIPEYVKRLKRIGKELGGSLSVYAGLELAFVLLATDFYSLGLGGQRGDMTRKLDFLLFEYVSDPLWCGMDLIELLNIRPMLGAPVGLAHCDIDRVFGARLPPADLAGLLAEQEIFVELCPSSRNSRPVPRQDRDEAGGRSFLPYYRVGSSYMDKFFKAAKDVGVMFSIGTDAHGGVGELARIDDAVEFIRERGLENRIIDLEARLQR